MKKILIIPIALLMSIGVARSQSDKVSLGINVVGNYTGYAYGDHGQATRPRVGYGAGLSVTVAITSRINIETGLQYDAFNSKVDVVMDPFSPAKTYGQKECITLPVLFQYEFGPKEMFFVNVGPALKFNLSHRQRMEFGDNYVLNPGGEHNQGFIPAFTSTSDIGYRERNVTLALIAGVGMKVPLVRKLDFVWEARFTGDITNVNNPDITSDQFRLLNVSLKAGLAYRF